MQKFGADNPEKILQSKYQFNNLKNQQNYPHTDKEKEEKAWEGEEMERGELEEGAEVDAPDVKTDQDVQAVAEFSGARDLKSLSLSLSSDRGT